MNYQVQFLLPLTFFFIPFFVLTTAHAVVKKKNDETQRQSNIPSLCWADDRQGRRCRVKNKKNTRATTGNPELNERWSEVVAPVWLYARRRRAGERCYVRRRSRSSWSRRYDDELP